MQRNETTTTRAILFNLNQNIIKQPSIPSNKINLSSLFTSTLAFLSFIPFAEGRWLNNCFNFSINGYPYSLRAYTQALAMFEKAISAFQNNTFGNFTEIDNFDSFNGNYPIARYGDCEKKGNGGLYADLLTNFAHQRPQELEMNLISAILDSIQCYTQNLLSLTSVNQTHDASQTDRSHSNLILILATTLGTATVISAIAFAYYLRLKSAKNLLNEKEALLTSIQLDKKENLLEEKLMAANIDPSTMDKAYRCGLTGKMMVDPVISDDGESYEKEALENWMKKNNYSPSNPKIILENFIENRTLRDEINRAVDDRLAKKEMELNETKPWYRRLF